MGYDRLVPVAVLTAVAALLVGCGQSTTTDVLSVAMPLPEGETAVYRVLDRGGAQIGRLVLAISPAGDELRLTQDYDFGDGQTDRSVVLVDRGSMRAHRSERLVTDGDHRYETEATYEPGKVVVTFTDGSTERTRVAEVGESTYDNLESLFLWRTLPMGAGETARYVSVVVDPKRGTISRPLATVTVSGREEVPLPGGTVEAWRVDFSSAGVTNRAWYAVTPDRRLVKYAIAHGPTLLLESATP